MIYYLFANAHACRERLMRRFSPRAAAFLLIPLLASLVGALPRPAQAAHAGDGLAAANLPAPALMQPTAQPTQTSPSSSLDSESTFQQVPDVLRAFILGGLVAAGLLGLLGLYSASRAVLRPRIIASRLRRQRRREADTEKSSPAGAGEDQP
jgi:hypothetical protein